MPDFHKSGIFYYSHLDICFMFTTTKIMLRTKKGTGSVANTASFASNE